MVWVPPAVCVSGVLAAVFRIGSRSLAHSLRVNAVRLYISVGSVPRDELEGWHSTTLPKPKVVQQASWDNRVCAFDACLLGKPTVPVLAG